MKPKLCTECGIDITGSRNKQCSYKCRNKAKAISKAEKKARQEYVRKAKCIEKQISDAKLDELWREIIRLKYNNRCAIDKTLPETDREGNIIKNHDAHHIEGRGRSVRWWIPNGILVSSLRHKWHKGLSAHGTVEKFKKWVKKKIMSEYEYNQLVRRRNSRNKWTNNEWRDYLVAELHNKKCATAQENVQN